MTQSCLYIVPNSQMASSSDKGISSPAPLLISKVLHSGDSVKIGRKSSCEVMVKSPFVSGTHCKIDVTRPGDATSKKSSSNLCFFVSDLSSNGTWLLKSLSRYDGGPAKSRGKDGRNSKKLGKTKEEFLPGDCILLLAPTHEQCMQYRFMVKKKGSEYILEQLPATFKWNEETATKTPKENLGLKKTESKPAVVGMKRSTSASGGDHTKKRHCGYSLSGTR